MGAQAADRGPRFRLLGDVSAYVKAGMDVQEVMLSEGITPTEPGWGEEPPTSWGHIATGTDRRVVPTFPAPISTSTLKWLHACWMAPLPLSISRMRSSRRRSSKWRTSRHAQEPSNRLIDKEGCDRHFGSSRTARPLHRACGPFLILKRQKKDVEGPNRLSHPT